MKNKGISLIVLVITIIVMIILAAAIIISLNNTGIIGNANKAVEETNEKTVQEIANLAWGEAYADGARSVDKLKEAVEKALENNNINVGDYGINVTENGVDVSKGWIQTENRTVIRGTQILNIGDTIEYHDKAGENGTKKYTGTWQILGAENGKLLIISTENVDMKSINEPSTLKGGQDKYTVGAKEIEDMCKVYGTGEGAIGARSITIEDIDRITGYDKTKFEYLCEGKKVKYGESVTYYWDTTTENQKKPYYVTESGITGNLKGTHSRFVWYDGVNWQINTLPETLPAERQKICTLTNTFYGYVANEDTTLTKTNTDGTTNEIYKMLFGNDDKLYWLASSCIMTNSTTGFAIYGLNVVHEGFVDFDWALSSNGIGWGNNLGVRAVVTLSPSIKLNANSTNGYDIK